MGLRQDESDRINEQVDSLLDRTKKLDNPFNLVRDAEKNGTVENDSNPNTESLKEAEENTTQKNQTDWLNNVSGKERGGKSKGKGALKFLKRKGPLITIVSTISGLVGMLGFIGNPAFLTQNILANLVQKFNTQETSLTIRTNKVIARKMSGEATTGICTEKINIACKFTKPSNRFLTQLEKNGITALDKDGKAITKNGLFPNTRPVKYNFTNSAGQTVQVDAKELYSRLVGNAEFRAAFHSAYNPRFMGLADSIFSSIKTRFRFNTNDKLSKTTDEKSLNKEVNENSGGNKAIKNAVGEGQEAAAEAAAKKIIQDEADVAINKMGKAGKASVLNLAAAGACFVTDIPGLAVKAGRAFQMGQLIRYGMVFLSAFGAVKAGDATPEQSGAIGDALTKVVNGKSAMDSFGMKYAITGDVIPADTNYKKFAPGSNLNSTLKSVTIVTESPLKQGTCRVATDWRTGVALDVALAGSWVGLIPAALNAALGYAASEVIAWVIPPIFESVIGLLPMQSILEHFYGDLTQDLSGEGIGDALASGASHVMGQTANAGGNMPLNPVDAVAYNNLTKQVQLAYAEEDRATKSPLDINNPNTMLGSIVQQFIPYYISNSSNVGSIKNTFSAMSNIIAGSFSMALKPLTINANAQTTDPSQYQLCDDPILVNSNVAADPYCSIFYGIPAQYLDEDPLTIVNSLIESKDIDEDTGEPIVDSDLDIWKTMCTDGRTDQAENCKITDKKIASYALYTIDHRIQKTMDDGLPQTTTDGDSGSTGGSTDPGDSSQPDNTEKRSNGGWTLINNTDYSGVQCAAGSTDEGIYNHPTEGFKIRKCKTPIGVVASLISQRTINLATAAKNAGYDFSSSSGFRTYEIQQTLRQQNCPDPVNSPASSCSPPTARPGKSMHEKGLAIDFRTPRGTLRSNNPEFSWLKQNGASYGYINLPSESWHWSMNGG